MDGLAYLAIHSVAHKLKTTKDTQIKSTLAETALHLMDSFEVLHPNYIEIYSYYVPANGSAVSKYGEEWAANIEKSSQQELFMGDEFIGQSGKNDFFDKFVPQFRRLFIAGDFTNLRNLLNKVTLSVHFIGQCSDITSFAENRYFEFLFYQIIAIIYGSLWFPSAAELENPNVHVDEVSPSLKWTQIERKCRAYHEKSCEFVKGTNEARSEIVARVEAEQKFGKLVQWYCALAKFKENRFTEFCADFESLQNDIDLLKTVSFHSQTLILYEIASIASKQFKELNFHQNELVIDLCTGNTRVEAHFYEVLNQLSEANFSKAKSAWTSSLLTSLDAEISYGLPSKSRGTFWDYMVTIIDLKTFLLVLSVCEMIDREKMIDKLGYEGACEKTRAAVSDNLVMSLAVLGLGDSNIFFDQEKDAFFNLPVTDQEKESALADTIEVLDHKAKTEAAAAHMKTLLIRKYFT